MAQAQSRHQARQSREQAEIRSHRRRRRAGGRLPRFLPRGPLLKRKKILVLRTPADGTVELHTQSEMLDLVIVGGRAKGIIVRDLITGAIERHAADAVVLATGGYGNVFNLSTYARGSNATAIWRAYKRGACFANPCYTQIHPTCIPMSGEYQSKLTLMSESLRNDGRIWVPKRKEDRLNQPAAIADPDRDYYLERIYPSFGNLCPPDA